MEVSNGIIKWVHSLAQKKNRDRERCFVAEGTKCVFDTLGTFRLRGLFCTENWLRAHNVERASVVSSVQIERMSMLKTPTEVIAVYEMPDYGAGLPEAVNNLNLALDGVQDPGNVGTLIRTAVAAGVSTIAASRESASLWSPKALRAAMGAHFSARLYENVEPEDLDAAFDAVCLAADARGGSDIYETADWEKTTTVWMMGAEGPGLSEKALAVADRRLYIPIESGCESLNVGAAAAVCLFEQKRRRIAFKSLK